MKILVDILHPAHINFFKNIIHIFEKEGNEVVITALNRGKVPSIVRKEFADKEVYIIGRHRGTPFSIIFEANILRFFKMLFFVMRHQPKIGLSVGSFVSGFCFKLFNRKNYQVDDDPERFFNVLFEKFTATRLFFPPGVHSDHRKVQNFNCLKEWAYLSPNYFQPDKKVLAQYHLGEQEYFFIREVSTGTLNYLGHPQNPVAAVSNDFPEGVKVLLSLEDKSTRDQYPEHWLVLEEPVEDIHSLMYFSKGVISSGDSMAREGAMLGVPAIYCGIREMVANDILIRKGMLFHLTVEETLEKVREITRDKQGAERQERQRKQLLKEWDDINELLLNQIAIDINKS